MAAASDDQKKETGEWRGVEMKFIHSSGPGGQNVNKVATAVQLRFNPEESNLTEAQIARLHILAGERINHEGLLIITARTRRSQLLNKKEALSRLAELIDRAKAPPPRPRRATRPTKRAEEMRLADKKRRGRGKAARTAIKLYDE
ncbi:MAG: aminoacyl-tRNA hydrolase [Candidatus Adiutrix sp.]|jgi:ribosome-associated protein|nr:aminoacyl-tRNA hydrolase [Candidatus Adiutrix sp.]